MNNGRPIRIGILGAGRVAPLALIEPATRVPAVTIDAVASRSLDHARAFAARHAIRHAHGSYDALLDDEDVDAVYVALPTALHSVWTPRALAQGKHVLCEKPLAATAPLAGEMAAMAREKGRVLQEGMHMLYLHTLRRQRALTSSGRFGRVLRIASRFRHPSIPMLEDDFRLRFELGGGAALDMGCYAVACLRYIAGEEPEVRAVRSQCTAPQVDGWMEADLTFPSGASGIVEGGFRGSFERKFTVDVECERGRITWGPGGLTGTLDGEVFQESIPPTATFQLQLEAFAQQARGEPADALPPEEAVATARVVDAMYAHAGLAPRVALRHP